MNNARQHSQQIPSARSTQTPHSETHCKSILPAFVDMPIVKRYTHTRVTAKTSDSVRPTVPTSAWCPVADGHGMQPDMGASHGSAWVLGGAARKPATGARVTTRRKPIT